MHPQSSFWIYNNRTGIEQWINKNKKINDDGETILPDLHYKMDYWDYCGMTPLIVSIYNNRPDIVELLIQSHVDVNQKDNTDTHPLYWATLNNSIQIVEMLLNANASIDAMAKDGVTALWVASKHGYIHIVDLLIRKSASVNLKTTKELATPLMVALAWGREAVVHRLLAAGADVNVENRDGSTTFMISCSYSSIDIISKIIKMGVDVNKHNHLHHTAWSFFFQRRRIDINHMKRIVKLFLKAGFDVNSRSDFGLYPPLYYVIIRADTTEIVKMLLAAGANPDGTYGKNKPLLYLAKDQAPVEISLLLFAAGARNVNYKNGKGQPSLFSLIDYEGLQPERVDALLSYYLTLGADINASDNKGHTVLHYAQKRGYNKTCETLQSFPFPLQTLCKHHLHLEKIRKENGLKKQRTC